MKNCHLPSYNRVATLVLAAFITFVPSTGWAGIIEGNLTVEKNPSAGPSDGNLTVEGTTTLNGNINLGDDASDTTIFKRKVAANGNLTVNGVLKIQSVDSAGDGVITNIPDDRTPTFTIPTTQAVKDYVESKRNNNVRIYNSNEYTLTLAQSTSISELYILSGADAVPVVRQLGVNGTVMFVLRVNNLDNGEKFAKSTFITLSNQCSEGGQIPGYNMKHSYLDVTNSFFNARVRVNDASEQTHTVYFCLKVSKDPDTGYKFKTPVFDFAHISIH